MLAIAFVVYNHTIVVWLRPADAVPVPLAPIAAEQGPENIGDLFATNSWQTGACKRFQTPDAMLLFDHLENDNDGNIRVSPVTIVIGRGLRDDPSSRAIVLESKEGAEIRFANRFDFASGGAPPIQRGRLLGDVTISSRGNGWEGEPSLSIQTKSVSLDRQRLWTTEKVDVQIGAARLVGRDLTLHLNRQAGTKIEPDRLELIYLEKLALPLAEMIKTKPTSSERDKNKPAMPRHLDIACGGRVEYDFANDTLSMRDTITITAQHAAGMVDRFDAQTLSLRLRSPQDRSMRRETAADWIAELTAAGSPASAAIQSQSLELSANQLYWDAVSGSIRAEGPQGVRLRRGVISAGLSGLNYRYDPKAPKLFGHLSSEGPGLVQVDDPAQTLRSARWRGGISLRPVVENAASGSTHSLTAKDSVASSQLHSTLQQLRLQVYGGIDAKTRDGGSAHAEKIDGTLLADANGIRPDRFNIFGNVKIDTSKVRAVAEQIRLFFVASSNRRPGSSEPVSRVNIPDSRFAVKQPPQARLASRDQSGVAGMGMSTADESTITVIPEVQGRIVNAEVIYGGEKLIARRMTVENDIRVKAEIPVGGKPMLAELFGDQMQWIDGGGEDSLVLVGPKGENARLQLGDGFFEGPSIEVFPTRNEVKIQGGGEFQVPNQLMPTAFSSTSLTGSGTGTSTSRNPLAPQSGQTVSSRMKRLQPDAAANVEWIRPPHCTWKGDLRFDGRNVWLGGGVDIQADLRINQVPYRIDLTGEELHLVLSDTVQLRNQGNLQTISMSELHLNGSSDRPVFAEARAYGTDGVQSVTASRSSKLVPPKNPMTSRHVFHARQLSLVPDEEGPRSIDGQQNIQLVGKGPGWYRAWLETEDPKTSGASSRIASNTSSDTATIRAVHLLYRDSMVADLTSKEISFKQNVRIASRMVPSMQEVFEAGSIQTPLAGDTVLDCHQLRIGIDPVAPSSGQRIVAGKNVRMPPVEIQADGGVILKTNSPSSGLFVTSASMATYAAGTDLIKIRGSANRPATMEKYTLGDRSTVASVAGTFRTGSIKLSTLDINIKDITIRMGENLIPKK